MRRVRSGGFSACGMRSRTRSKIKSIFFKDLHPPPEISRAMQLQAESERVKRSKILESEGEMMAWINMANMAEGNKQEEILNGEGEAQKILQEADSLCKAINRFGGF